MATYSCGSGVVKLFRILASLVATYSGTWTWQVTFFDLYSAFRARENFSMKHFAPEYSARRGSVNSEDAEEMLMIAPFLRSAIPCRTIRVIHTVLSTFIVIKS